MWEKSREKKVCEEGGSFQLFMAYLLEKSSGIHVFNICDNLGAPCSFHASVSKKAFLNSLKLIVIACNMSESILGSCRALQFTGGVSVGSQGLKLL